MANDKATRINVFPYEFYKECCDMVDCDLLQVYEKALVSCSWGLMLNKGNIKFIPKPRDPEVVTN